MGSDKSGFSIPDDDYVVVFRTIRSDVRGRLARLGRAADQIVTPHAMPLVPSISLGEGLALTTLLSSALPGDGRVILQTRTDGIVTLIAGDCDAAGRLRGYARYDAGTLAVIEEAGRALDDRSVLGNGLLALTIETGPDRDRYQGVLGLEGAPLQTAAMAYFEQREALPTFVQLAVAQHFSQQSDKPNSGLTWRAGGLMLQDERREREASEDDEMRDGWSRARHLALTLKDHELLDPSLSAETLLVRLFHEEGVVIERVLIIKAECRCAGRDSLLATLKSFGRDKLGDLFDDDGRIAAVCEFCLKQNVFTRSDFDAGVL